MAHALLVSQKRSFHVVPVNKTAAEQKLTSEMERWLMGVFHVNNLRGKEDAVSMAIWNALVRKVGWVRVRWDQRYAEETAQPGWLPHQPTPDQGMVPPQIAQAMAAPSPEPVARFKELPIVLQSVDPKNVFVRHGGAKGIQYLFYSAKRTIEDIVAELGEAVLPERYLLMDWKERLDKDVWFMEYWGWNDALRLQSALLIGDSSDEEPGEWLNGYELDVVEGYDDIPYVAFYCYRTPSTQPELRMRGMLDTTKDLVHMQEKLLSASLHAVKMFAIMPLVATEGTGSPIDVPTGIGTVVHLRQGQSLSFPQWPGTPPDLTRLLTIAEDKIQESGFPSVTYGQGPGGTSGYAIGQYNEGARARLNLPRANAEMAMTQICHLMMELAATFSPNTALPVWGHLRNKTFYTELTGMQMRGHVVEVKIASDLPIDQIRNATLGAQLKAQGALSDRTIQERYFGVEDTEGEAEQMAIERAQRHPLTQLIAMGRALAVDADPMARLTVGEIQKVINQMMAPMAPGAEAQMNVPGAPQPGMGPPPPKPRMPSAEVMPPIAQGQVLRQEMGLPPTNREMMTGRPG
jgi:hypothetical protein